MGISLAQGLFMAEAEGFLEHPFVRDFKKCAEWYDGIVPSEIFIDLVEKHSLSAEEAIKLLACTKF